MQPRIRSLLGALLLLTGPALAQVPSTLPANSVLGRLGVGPGPMQAIPLATLFSSAHSQPTSANLTALLALGGTGFPTRTGTDVWAQRSIAGTANEICVTNGDGISGNPTIGLCSTFSLSGKTISGGTFTSAALNGTLGGITPANVSGTNGTFTGYIETNNSLGANTRGQILLRNSSTGTVGSIFGYSGLNPVSALNFSTDGSATSGSAQIYTYNAGVPALALNVDHLGNIQFPHYGCIGLMQFDSSGNASCSFGVASGTITGLSNPTNSGDAANKAYVDLAALGLQHLITESRLATAAVLPNSPTYSNGTAGVGATLTAGSNTTLTVDGTAAVLNDIILVKNQAAPAENGQYYVSTAGSGGAPWVLTRCTAAACGIQFNNAATMLQGSYTRITAGSANIGRSYALAATVSNPGTTAANFALTATSSAQGILYTAPGSGALTRVQSAFNADDVRLTDFAANDGSLQTTQIQNAFTYAKSISARVSIPCGTYLVDNTIDITGAGFEGNGLCSHIKINADHPIFKIDLDQASAFFNSYKNVYFESVSGANTATDALKIVGSDNTKEFSHNTISGISCTGLRTCIDFDNTQNVGGENEINWNLITNIHTIVSNQRSIIFERGSGTGNIISNSNLNDTSQSIGFLGGDNSHNIGDITISGIQMGGTGTCIYLSGTATYKSNIAISSAQCDAGKTTSILADGYTNLRVNNQTFGGATSYNMTNSTMVGGDFGPAPGQRLYGKEYGINGVTPVAVFSATFRNTGVYAYGGLFLEISAAASVNFVGGQIRTSRYHIAENGDCTTLAVTQLDTSTTGASPYLTLSTARSTCTITFTLTPPAGSSGDGHVIISVRAMGGYFDASMP